MRTNERAASTGLGCGTRTPSHVQPWLGALGLSLLLSSPPPHSCSCPTGHPTAWAVPPLCLNHAAAAGCTTGLHLSSCPCAQPLALVWLCKPAHLFFPCACLLHKCIPSPLSHPLSACTFLLHMCTSSTCVCPLSSCASLLISILLPFVHPFSTCTSLFFIHFPSHFVHHFSTCASLPHMHIPSLHTHPFSLCASLLLVCIPSPHMCPFSPYASLLLMCIPSPLVHPFSPQAPIMTQCLGAVQPPGHHPDPAWPRGLRAWAPQGQLGWAGVPQPQRPACWIWPAGMMEQMMLLV